MNQRSQTLVRRGVTAIVEIEKIKRGREAFDLNLGRFDLGLAKITQNARPNESHDQADD